MNRIENISIFIGIIIATIIVAYLVNRFFSRMIRRSTEVMDNDPTNYQFLKHAISALVYIVGFGIAIYTMPNLRALANSLLAGAGILAVAIGFAAQHALGNIISGVFIVMFKPFRINDRLKIQTYTGIVEDITLRHTVIRDFENNRILIPNTVISDEIIVNSDFAKDKICKWIDISISYDSNLDLAKQIIAEEVLKHPLHLDPRTAEQIEAAEPEVPVRVLNLGEYAVQVRAWAWAKDAANGFLMSCDVLEGIKKRFDAEGIEIPYPHRTLVHKNTSK